MRSFHLTWSAVGRHPLFPAEADRLRALRALCRVAGDVLALFCIVDDHVHVVLFCDPSRVGRLARAILLALRPFAAVPLEPAFVRPVLTRSHLEWLADEYILTQSVKHGLAGHPALYGGSCFQDIVGARLVAGLHLRLGEALPRYQVRRAHAAVGLPSSPLAPATDVQIRAAGASSLVAAAGRALAADPELEGRNAAVVAARRVSCHLGDASGIPRAEIAHALRITRQGASRLASLARNPQLERAVRLQLTLHPATRG